MHTESFKNYRNINDMENSVYQAFSFLFFFVITALYLFLLLSLLPSEFTDVSQEIIYSVRDGKCALLLFLWGLALVMSPLTHSHKHDCMTNRCTQFDSLPSPMLSSISSLSPSYLPRSLLFYLSCALFCPLFSLQLLDGNNGQSCKYLWCFLRLISKDWLLQEMPCLWLFLCSTHFLFRSFYFSVSI